jgi:O-antigen/teichoic acid export membrane protein
MFAVLFFILDDFFIRFYSERSPLFVDFYLWVLPLTLFIVYFEVLNNYLRSLRDSTTGSLVNDIVQRIFAILFLALYFFGLLSFAQFISLFVFSYASQPLLIAIQIFRKKEFKLRPNFGILRKPLVRGMANYSIFSLLGGLTTVLVWNIDVIMLGSMTGLESTAVYAIAFYIGSVIAVPQRSIEKIAGPLLSDFIKNKKWADVASIYRKTSINQLIPGVLIFGLIWLNLDPLFMILPEVYSGGKWVIFVIGIGKIIEVMTGANGIILLNSKHYRVSFYTNIILVAITITANLLLIPIYGIVGAAIASALALFVYNSVKFLYIWMKMGMQPFSLHTLIVTGLGGAVLYIAANWISIEIMWLEIMVKSLVYMISFLVPLIFIKSSPELNRLIFQTLNKDSNESTTG